MAATAWVFSFLVSLLLVSTLIKARTFEEDDDPWPGNCPGYPMARCSRVTRTCKSTNECSKGELCCVALCEIRCAKPRGNQSLPRKRQPKRRRGKQSNRKLTRRGSTTRRVRPNQRRRPNRRGGANRRRRPNRRRNGTRRGGANRRWKPIQRRNTTQRGGANRRWKPIQRRNTTQRGGANRRRRPIQRRNKTPRGGAARRRRPIRRRNGTRQSRPKPASPTPSTGTQRTTTEMDEFDYENCQGYPMAKCFAPVRRHCNKTAECQKGESCCLAFCDIRCAKPRGNRSRSA